MEKRQKVTAEQQSWSTEAPEPSHISSNVSTATVGLVCKTIVTSKLKGKKKKSQDWSSYCRPTTLDTPVVVRHLFAAFKFKAFKIKHFNLNCNLNPELEFLIFLSSILITCQKCYTSLRLYFFFKKNKTSNWWFISVVTKFLHKHGKEYKDHLGSTAFRISKLAIKRRVKAKGGNKGHKQ